MITLGLDTTGAWCTAALISETDFLSQKSEDIGRGHAERLAPMVEELLKEQNISPEQIDRIAVCTGPGSFTGLRVALAFARGFALPRKIPVIGLSALRVLAAQMDPHKEVRVVSVINVRRGEVMWAAYDKRAEISAPITQPIDKAKAAIDALGYDRLAGDGAELIHEPSSILVVSGYALAHISQDFDPAEFPAMPLYARGPDAKPQKISV